MLNLIHLFSSGSSLLVKPITEQGAVGTNVYFPGSNEVRVRDKWNQCKYMWIDREISKMYISYRLTGYFETFKLFVIILEIDCCWCWLYLTLVFCIYYRCGMTSRPTRAMLAPRAPILTLLWRKFQCSRGVDLLSLVKWGSVDPPRWWSATRLPWSSV